MEGEPSRKRRRTTDEGKKKRAPPKLTPLRKFRNQTLSRKKELQRIIRESNRELRAIVKDLGKLSRK